jgi:hypothetical protein
VGDGAIHQSSHPEVTIQLPCITDVSQLKLNSKPFVLRLMTSDNRKYLISLPNTSDLQKWSHCVASRRRRAHIGEPEGFEFHVHVSWDPKSQAFTVSYTLFLSYDMGLTGRLTRAFLMSGKRVWKCSSNCRKRRGKHPAIRHLLRCLKWKKVLSNLSGLLVRRVTTVCSVTTANLM